MAVDASGEVMYHVIAHENRWRRIAGEAAYRFPWQYSALLLNKKDQAASAT